eukprot:1825448-Lingulodinium_polyedra.AAC.1
MAVGRPLVQTSSTTVAPEKRFDRWRNAAARPLVQMRATVVALMRMAVVPLMRAAVVPLMHAAAI